MNFEIALTIVGAMIALVGIYAGIVSVWLMVKYVKFNRKNNSAGLSGQEVARKILDDNGLQDIKVKATGSLTFGNSYSHYFKKVRLRRLTRHEKSLTSLGMGAQKASLAILDKEGDPDMRKQIRLFPLITFGPFAFFPLLLIGAALDFYVFHQTGIATIVACVVGILFFAFSLVLSILTLKTEKKAQEKAYTILAEKKLVTNEELDSLKELFRLYNIQYINDIILSSLELLYFALEILAAFQGNSSSSSKK